MLQATHKKITGQIEQFCKTLVEGKKPIWVSTKLEGHELPLTCYHTVREKVQSQGGRSVLGWMIYIWPHKFIECEAHCVWEKDGEMINTTPINNHDNSKPILFLEDPSLAYNYDNPTIIRNKRLCISKDPLFRDFFKLADEIIDIDEASETIYLPNGMRQVSYEKFAAKRLEEIMYEQYLLTRQIYTKHVKGNVDCFCGSSKKYKKCCGQHQ